MNPYIGVWAATRPKSAITSGELYTPPVWPASVLGMDIPEPTDAGLAYLHTMLKLARLRKQTDQALLRASTGVLALSEAHAPDEAVEALRSASWALADAVTQIAAAQDAILRAW